MFHRYFPTYVVEEPESHEVSGLDGRSYVMAGLFGCFYVLFKGFLGRFFLALAVDLGLLAMTVVVGAGVANYMGGAMAWIALMMLALGFGVVRSVPMIAIVKNGYRRRGWRLMRV